MSLAVDYIGFRHLFGLIYFLNIFILKECNNYITLKLTTKWLKKLARMLIIGCDLEADKIIIKSFIVNF